MSQLQIVRHGDTYGVYSFVDGFVAKPQQTTIYEEVRQRPEAVEAVINRLIRQGEWELAEEVMDTYLH